MSENYTVFSKLSYEGSNLVLREYPTRLTAFETSFDDKMKIRKIFILQRIERINFDQKSSPFHYIIFSEISKARRISP